MSDDEQQYRSDAFAAIHKTMTALHNIGAVDKATMRQFDETCLRRGRCWVRDKLCPGDR